LRCEVCGRGIRGKPFNVMIEGARLMVCSECSKLGKACREEPGQKPANLGARLTPKPVAVLTRKPQAPKIDTTLELVENFDLKIRQARERLGLSHEDLGKRINEKVSLLRKIETGKMTPDNRLATILEHALKIKLIDVAKEEKVPQAGLAKSSGRDVTLGDLVQLDRRGGEKEDTAGRKRS
jgi:putative transcription factor